MTKKEILKFVDKVIKDENLNIYFVIKYKKINLSLPCEVILYRGYRGKTKSLLICNLFLNKKIFNRKTNRNLLKAYILHELGHCFFECRSKYKNELYAQLWAICKTRKLKIKFVEKHLIDTMKTWIETNWQNYKFRRYILAAKKYFNKENV